MPTPTYNRRREATTKTKGAKKTMKTPKSPPDSPVVLADELAQLLKVSMNTLAKMLKDPGFPLKPLPFATRARRWRRTDVNDFLGISQ